MPAQIGHAFANPTEAYARSSALIAAFLCRRRHARALIFDFEPDLLIRKGQGDAGGRAVGMAGDRREGLFHHSEKPPLQPFPPPPPVLQPIPAKPEVHAVAE